MNKILIIDTSDIGASYTAKALLSLGYEPVFLINLNDFQGDTVKDVTQYQHYHVNTKSLSELLDLIKKENMDSISGVFTALDSKIPIAVELATHLKVRSMPRELIKLANKSQVTSLIPDFCPPSLTLMKDNFNHYKSSIEAFASQHKKLLLKPCNAAGGIGVKIIDSSVEQADLIHHMNTYSYNEWLLMAYIPGELVSLEGFVFNGKCTFLGFTSRQKIGNTESYLSFPIDMTLPESITFCAKEAVENLVHLSSFNHGYFHSEFMVTKEECFLIDANFGRIGGGPLIELIAYSFDISPIDIMKHIIQISLFPEQNFKESPYQQKRLRESAGVNYGISKQATLLSVEVPIHPEIKHTRLLNDGSVVPQMGINNWAWVGLVSGPKQAIQSFMNQTKIKTKEGIFPPCY